MPANKKITIKDIAEYCHVSPSTVSRVMNGNSLISEATRKRVMDAAAAWGYVPNASAKTLRMHTSRLVGVFVNSLDYEMSSSVISRLHDLLAEKGFASIVCNIGPDAEKEEYYYQMMLSLNVCAIFLNVNRCNYEIDQKSLIPMIYVYKYPLQPELRHPVCQVVTDDYGAGYQAGCELLRLGCQRIAEIRLTSRDSLYPLGRHLGLMQSLYDHGTPYEESLSVVSEQYDYKTILEKINRRLEEQPAANGYFCSSDLLALALVEALELHSYQIPEEVKIIGCNDMSVSLHSSKPISTIRHRTDDICQAAIAIMERMVSGAELTPEDRKQTFPTDFIPRATT